MTTPSPIGQRWNEADKMQGWQVYQDGEAYVEALTKAALRRHPNNSPYTPMSQEKPLTDAESEHYGQLNERLHETLRRTTHELFDGVPVPQSFPERRRTETLFTPFTYQNYDWYNPSYEVYVVILTDYVSSSVLRRLQLLLVDDFQDWCIVVVGSDSFDFTSDHEIFVFSDQIIANESGAAAMQIPAEFH